MKKHKFWIVIILLLFSIILSFAFPRTKYVGTDFISQLEIPNLLSGWQGKDITDKLNINLEDTRFGFISQIVAYEYVNASGENLLFIVLDAGNFHHPNVCFTSSGFEIRELGDTEFRISGRTFKAHTLYTERGTESYLSFYWISIDKKIVHKWIEQKIKQLYFSLFNKKRVGLMVRLDIPTRGENIEDARTLAKQFVRDLSQALQEEHADYIFGKSN